MSSVEDHEKEPEDDDPRARDGAEPVVGESEDEESNRAAEAEDRLVDEQGKESFPASDPPAH